MKSEVPRVVAPTAPSHATTFCHSPTPPWTVAGLDLDVVVPSPNCPVPFAPQVQIEPSIFTATICVVDVAISFQLVPPPATVPGLDLDTVEPVPSCPELPNPQVHNVPSILTAAVVLPPQETFSHVVPPPATVPGLDLSMFDPSPSAPKDQVEPQVHKVPSLLIAADMPYPAETLIQSLPPPATVPGLDLFVVVPVPKTPDEPCPQVYSSPLDVTARV